MTATKINLLNDYNYVAHPSVLEALQAYQDDRFVGYALDPVSDDARATILELVGLPQAEVHFVTGGTQANLITISAALRPHEAVIAASSGHIVVHETGAIEATGHKVLTHDSADGKVKPEAVQALVLAHNNDHMVKPRLVYLSQTTELGTVYTLAELQALRAVCDELDLLLFADGARLGCALTADKCDHNLAQMAELLDAFYIGGTKNGLLYGEALVLCNPILQKDFRYQIKQRSGLLGKGFILGIQFQALFKDDLYFKLARQGNERAAELDTGLKTLGYSFEVPTESNQVFPILNNKAISALAEKVEFNLITPLENDQSSIRFVTTWQTTPEEIQATLNLMA